MNAPELLRARWAQMPSRERRLVVLGVSVVALALLWWLALAPALHTLRGAPEQHRQLDGQLQRMRQLQAQAQSLQQRPQTQLADAKRALEQSVRQQFGPEAQLQISEGQATLTLKQAPADKLAQWLAQVRSQSAAHLTQARIQRDTANKSAPATWSGTLVLSLPQP